MADVRVTIVGGGPGGLYLAMLLRRANPQHEVTVLERNPPGETAGFGILLTDEPAGGPEHADLETFRLLAPHFVTLPASEVRYADKLVRTSEGLYHGIARGRLLGVLQERCRALGVRLLEGQAVEHPATDPRCAEADLIVAADGARSRVRDSLAQAFGTTVDPGNRRYSWLGTRRRFEQVRLSFQEHAHGLFYAYAYRYDQDTSSFVVECETRTWRQAGLDTATEAEMLAYLEQAFQADLEGYPLQADRSRWTSALTVRNERWHTRIGPAGERGPAVVLLGDAAHTAHFTTGLATRAAMLDGVALVRAIQAHPQLTDALAAYEAERLPAAEEARRNGEDTVSWLEGVSRHLYFVSLVSGR